MDCRHHGELKVINTAPFRCMDIAGITFGIHGSMYHAITRIRYIFYADSAFFAMSIAPCLV